jgi:Flp pilus assembly protein TadD
MGSLAGRETERASNRSLSVHLIRGGDVMMKGNARASLTLVVVACLCACGSRRGDNEPIAECMAYAKAAEPCFGAQAAAQMRASFATPPKDESARAALQARCIEQRARVQRACH